MKKAEAIALLGNTHSSAARAIGITTSAVSQWPDDLPPSISDRVQAALWRMEQEAKREAEAQAHAHADETGAS